MTIERTTTCYQFIDGLEIVLVGLDSTRPDAVVPMTLRLTPEHETEIRARFHSGRCSGLDIAYLLDELDAVRKDREDLWMLLDNIDTLDDACRSDDVRFRELTRRQQQRRFAIYNPWEAHEGRRERGEDREGAVPTRNDRVDALPEARHDLQGSTSAEHLVARAGGADSGSTRTLATCRHGAWEADEHGVQCCVFCGMTAHLTRAMLEEARR
jgi:hypothetical protein